MDRREAVKWIGGSLGFLLAQCQAWTPKWCHGQSHREPRMLDAEPHAGVLKHLGGPARLMHSIAFSRDGSHIAAVAHDPSFRVWVDINSLVQGGPPSILTDGQDPVLVVWDVSTGGLTRKIGIHRAPTRAVVFSSDGSRIALGGAREYRPREPEIWDILPELQRNPEFSTRGQEGPVASGGLLNVQELIPGHDPLMLIGHKYPISVIAFGSSIVSIDSTDVLKVWDTESGRCLRTINELNDKGRTKRRWVDDEPRASFSDDASRAVVLNYASGPQGRTSAWSILKLWDLSQANYRTWDTRKNTDVVASVALSPDGKQLAVGLNSGKITIFEFCSLRAISEFQTPVEARPSRLVFSPDGSLLVSWSKAITVWNPTTRRLLRTIPSQGDMIRAVTLHNGHLRVASGGTIALDGRTPPGNHPRKIDPLRVWDTGLAHEK